ncbi:MAG: hypothetical protein JXA73_16510 [Acidobacteria bacterium]|nr:hypothetical protein [Acidobacteriota bacterium]
MKFSTKYLSIIALLLSVFAVPLLCEEIPIAIEIAPSTLNLAYQGQVVTVHTNIDYDLVVGASVKLNGIEIDWWKSDDRGNFVAKFDVDSVKDIVEPGTATLTLTGDTKDGDHFSGTSTIKIVNVGKK